MLLLAGPQGRTVDRTEILRGEGVGKRLQRT